ncbi:hypothetical protein CPAR01_10544 [Colletotrichum paranaense]|uniref:Uncharacterized protein n=1 Tax=Colletotrichum paranaense TaxID=1914294 RepID=A0ABQ9SEK3_9PEZI|nr:uncharacterized protein CPAR01_10544 [Colletotrichum paranaense]KAK1533836.1 hypothetical protein CPAR01_10544 [Colletotrichum paranaense]
MQDEMASLDNFGTIFLILRYDLSHDQRPHWEPRLLAIPSRPPQRVETSWGSTHSRLASSVLFGGLLSYAEPAAHDWCHRVRYIQAGRVANRASFGAKPQEPGRAAASSAEPSPGLRLVLVGFMRAFICRRQPSHDGGQKQSRTLPLRAVSPAAVSPLGTETGGGFTTGVITRRLNEDRLPSKKRQQSGRRKMSFFFSSVVDSREWSLPVAVYDSPVNSELVAVIKHFSKVTQSRESYRSTSTREFPWSASLLSSFPASYNQEVRLPRCDVRQKRRIPFVVPRHATMGTDSYPDGHDRCRETIRQKEREKEKKKRLVWDTADMPLMRFVVRPACPDTGFGRYPLSVYIAVTTRRI